MDPPKGEKFLDEDDDDETIDPEEVFEDWISDLRWALEVVAHRSQTSDNKSISAESSCSIPTTISLLTLMADDDNLAPPPKKPRLVEKNQLETLPSRKKEDKVSGDEISTVSSTGPDLQVINANCKKVSSSRAARRDDNPEEATDERLSQSASSSSNHE